MTRLVALSLMLVGCETFRPVRDVVSELPKPTCNTFIYVNGERVETSCPPPSQCPTH